MRPVIAAFTLVLAACTSGETWQEAQASAAAKLKAHREAAAKVDVITVSVNQLSKEGVSLSVRKGWACFRHTYIDGKVYRLCTPEVKWLSPNKPDFFQFSSPDDSRLMTSLFDAYPHGPWSYGGYDRRDCFHRHGGYGHNHRHGCQPHGH